MGSLARFFRYRTVSKAGTTPSGIPKVVWSYWADPKAVPMIVRMCLETWERWLPGFTIIVVSPYTLPRYLPGLDVKAIPWNDSAARESDIIRLNLLAQYGGLWSDASMLLLGTPGFMPLLDRCPVVLYYQQRSTTDQRYKVVESWWFATVPGGQFVTAWRDAFMMPGFKGSIGDRVRHYRTLGVNVQNIGDSLLEYLLIHIAAQYVLQKVFSPADVAGLCFLKAEDGPFQMLSEGEWDCVKSMERLCFSAAQPAATKLIKQERNALTEKHLHALMKKMLY